VNPNTQTKEFSLRKPDGYYVTISALSGPDKAPQRLSGAGRGFKGQTVRSRSVHFSQMFGGIQAGVSVSHTPRSEWGTGYARTASTTLLSLGCRRPLGLVAMRWGMLAPLLMLEATQPMQAAKWWAYRAGPTST